MEKKVKKKMVGDEERPGLLQEMALQYIGFKIVSIAANKVEGRFLVHHKLCQPSNVLHPGILALVAESLASAGACVASRFERVAGIELSINHHRAAPKGIEILASSTPIHIGKILHVWEVKFTQADMFVNASSSRNEEENLIATSKVTVMAGLGKRNVEKDGPVSHSRL